jgi:3-oxoacyl-[acyl-carrier-protein] synthase III
MSSAASPAPSRLRSSVGSAHARILGVGGYRPARIVTNEEICQHIDSSDEWIRERSGIVTRRFAGPEEAVVEMSVSAAGKAMAQAGISPEQVGSVLVATVSHLWQTPSAAVEVAHRIGAASASAFDISAACAGFCYGVGLGSDMVRAGSAEYVVVVGVERLTDILDLTDRSTAFLFGDGAGAVVIGPADEPGIGPVVWGADGGRLTTITQTASWRDVHDQGLDWPTLRMNGPEVFRWAVWQMAPIAQRALAAAGIAAQDLGAFIPHQANVRIIDAMVKALRLPAHVPVARDVTDTGNTSAASIPLAMERMLESGDVRSGSTALLIGFGAGLVYAAQVVTMP